MHLLTKIKVRETVVWFHYPAHAQISEFTPSLPLRCRRKKKKKRPTGPLKREEEEERGKSPCVRLPWKGEEPRTGLERKSTNRFFWNFF